MTENETDKEKKVLFKLSFASQKDSPAKNNEPQMVTEWNYNRIAVALLILLAVIALLISLFQQQDLPQLTDNKPIIEQPNQSLPDDSITTNPKSNSNDLAETIHTPSSSKPDIEQVSSTNSEPTIGTMLRAQLAKGIWQDEPFGKITDDIEVNSEQATGIYYFTELENMKGQTITHIWKYKDRIIFKKQKDIIENRWKTYTSKLFTRRSIGPWTVETVDSQGNLLNLINFNVVGIDD